MRILFVSIEYPPETPDGIGSYVAEIAPALVRRGHDVHVLSCLPGQAVSDVERAGVHVHRRGERRLRGLDRLDLPKTTARLRHALSARVEARRLGRFDVIEAPDWMAEGLGLSFRRPAPLVVHLHTPLEVTARYGGSRRSLDLRLASALERRGARRADLLTSPSRRLLAEVGPAWLEGKEARIVRLPIAPDEEVAPVEGTRPLVLCVGRLEPLKAPELLVRAAAELPPSAEVVFVGRSAAARGGKPYGEWLAGSVSSDGAPVRFAPHVPRSELRRHYAEARVVAVPSRHENFPYGGLEALAAGRPVVCRTTNGLAELLDGSGAGAVVEGDEPGAFADALRPFLDDPARAAAAGAEGRALVARCCAPDEIAAQREACYEAAVSSRRRRRSPSDTGA
jgi:glycosyltransferase involved in cell wall biosynthesis